MDLNLNFNVDRVSKLEKFQLDSTVKCLCALAIGFNSLYNERNLMDRPMDLRIAIAHYLNALIAFFPYRLCQFARKNFSYM